MPDFADLDEKIALKKENERLLAALKKYGRHDGGCEPWRTLKHGGGCLCGLAEALKGEARQHEESCPATYGRPMPCECGADS